ncbi:MAG: polysaccharide deacetylase family protein [Anaerolineaceae bacterium]
MNLAERLGHPSETKLLVLHSDDMGSCEAANLATFELMEAGRLTSGSIIMPSPHVQQVADYQRTHPEADLGVHLALTSEHPKSRWPGVLGSKVTPSLHDADGFLPMTTAQVVARADPEEAARELRAQLVLALEMGIDVTHLDSHMGTVFHRQFLSAWTGLAVEFGLPTFIPDSFRGRPAITTMEAAGVPVVDELIHDTYGPDRAAKEGLFTTLLSGIQPGFTHFLIHPAYDTSELRTQIVDWETRVADYEIFTEGSLHRSLGVDGVQLVGYRGLRDAIRAGLFKSLV